MKYKYNEDIILGKLKDYIDSTYKKHYSTEDENIQAIDYIYARHNRTDFIEDNIIKYASRIGKKGSDEDDIMKILHYAFFLYHFKILKNRDKEKQAAAKEIANIINGLNKDGMIYKEIVPGVTTYPVINQEWAVDWPNAMQSDGDLWREETRPPAEYPSPPLASAPEEIVRVVDKVEKSPYKEMKEAVDAKKPTSELLADVNPAVIKRMMPENIFEFIECKEEDMPFAAMEKFNSTKISDAELDEIIFNTDEEI